MGGLGYELRAKHTNEADLLAALDQHDAVVIRCVSGGIPYDQFEKKYDCFPEHWALDGHESTVDAWRLLD